MNLKLIIILYLIQLTFFLQGCAGTKSLLGIQDNEKAKPISNPFFASQKSFNDENSPMVLRTKKGDRSVELELPGNVNHLSDFVLPVSPAFKETGRLPASEEVTDTPGSSSSFDNPAKTLPPSVSDREIIQNFSQGSPQLELQRNELEKSLNLTPSNEDHTSTLGSSSYLISVDHVKQLYRSARYEAALFKVDELIQTYPSDPKLYEMRGTLLDRLGQRDLAIKSWKQALRFNPTNEALKRFVDSRSTRPSAGGP